MKRITYQLLQYGESVVTTDYEYDALNRLTSASYSDPNNPEAGGTAFGYTYDAAGSVLE